ncbi:MAG: NADH-quinone oxidoreductase subunit L [Thermoguttaceae bacterium]|nr:NADH-quinone oxidoreductase subunit L [Thermoguttaceae bacterium]MDW8079046.1 NADH-quinone oxidoreductase subunit L [Thermoguttaceae bacterium]
MPLLTGDWYVLAEFGHLRLTLGYYIDTLTILMVLMVTLVATLIHIYSLGYMHEELHPEVSDQEILAGDPPQPIRRPGRFARFFQYLSLFCFSMLGLVLANNLFMIFIFWELVGICSYLLIGFYLERPQAVRAASKAFIVNRVGDFGMLVGLAAWWGAAGTFHFADSPRSLGLFSRVAQAELDHNRTGQVVSPGIREQPSGQVVNNPDYPERPVAYGLLVLGGLGVFCGCVGKSAQFPLHVWLPDAMEGPTPVSALIHAATMVAAGVYLVGRFYPAFPPEVLLVVAVVGLASLLLAGMMALAATEIKRVLAFSTISQLGLMMFALGVGGWTAGLFHLLTHAFFKALLFLGAGSVIHCVGTGDMGQMGGLVRKIPWTAGTMLVGCLAIAGAGIPPWVGLSGFHSKDAVLAQAYLLMNYIPGIGHLLFSLALIGAAMTAFYMFRLWYLVFWGRPRSLDQLHHAHESPPVMVVPLVVLSVFAIIAGWRLPGLGWGIAPALEQARPISFISGQWWPWWVVPPEAESHQDSIHVVVSWLAFTAAAVGFVLATLFYGTGLFRLPSGVGVLNGLVLLLQRRFFIDELYQRLFVAPALHLASWAALIDRKIIDNLAEKLAAAVVAVANSGDLLDRKVVDGSLVGLGQGIYGLGRQLRQVQTGLLRQYLLAVVVGTIVIFVLVQFL